MQAICGFFRLDGQPATAEELANLRAALVSNPTQHQGRFVGWRQGSVALGSAGWGGRSPQGDESPVARHPETSCVVVADSRLDDRAALAHQLGLPDGQPATQAALILHAWLHWGERCVDELRGDFAFAIWDPREQRLFCARDTMGMRPLNVHYQPRRFFAFASRAQALLALPDVPDDLDEGRIADVLLPYLEGIDKTSTFYRAIRRLPPAHVADVRPDHYQTRRYWRLEPGRVALPHTDQGWAEALTDALETAVAHHLDGPQRVGSMVSGGMDSSSVAVVAAAQLAKAGRGPLPTFSSIDTSTDNPETRAALEMARLPGVQPTFTEPAAVVADRPEFLTASRDSDEPFEGPFVLSYVQYRAAARAGVDALLDGIDGDGLFEPGSTLVRQLQHLDWLGFARNVRGLHRTFPILVTPGYVYALTRAAFVPDWARRLRRRWRRDRGVAPAGDALPPSVIAPGFAARVDLRARLDRLDAWRPGRAAHDDTALAVRRLDHPDVTCAFEHELRIAAWYGVDARHPLADRGVLELCVNLPGRQRLRDGRTKACLRAAMRGRLPEPVRLRRDKRVLDWGLVTRVLLPDAASVRAALAEQREALEPYVDQGQLEAAFSGWDDPDARPGMVDLLAALNLGHWLQRRGVASPRRFGAAALSPQRAVSAVDANGSP